MSPLIPRNISLFPNIVDRNITIYGNPTFSGNVSGSHFVIYLPEGYDGPLLGIEGDYITIKDCYFEQIQASPLPLEKPLMPEWWGGTPMLKTETIYKTTFTQTESKGESTMFHFGIGSVLAIVLICVLTVKVIIPRLSWKYLIQKVVRFVWKPARKQAGIIEAEWKEETRKD